jgi:hypothetical protein
MGELAVHFRISQDREKLVVKGIEAREWNVIGLTPRHIGRAVAYAYHHRQDYDWDAIASSIGL